jgi:hypothetical protein
VLWKQQFFPVRTISNGKFLEVPADFRLWKSGGSPHPFPVPAVAPWLLAHPSNPPRLTAHARAGGSWRFFRPELPYGNSGGAKLPGGNYSRSTRRRQGLQWKARRICMGKSEDLERKAQFLARSAKNAPGYIGVKIPVRLSCCPFANLKKRPVSAILCTNG